MAGRSLPLAQPGHDATATPVFEKIAIVGLGLIGGSIALAARRKWPRGLLVAVDHHDVLERAMAMHAVDVAADDLMVTAEADLVVLAAPVRQNLDILGRLPDCIPGHAVITDTGSTKKVMVDGARALPPRLMFVGGHPLGGSTRGGIESARPDLFSGRPWLFTPEGDGPPGVLERLYRFAEGLGAVPRTVEAEDHDRLLALLSHLPQLTASALMHIVGEGAQASGLALAGRGLIDTTRLASSSTGIWRDICATNADAIGSALDALIETLRELRSDLGRGDALERIFESANRWRDELPG